MDWKEDLIDLIVRNVGGFASIAALIIYWRGYRRAHEEKGDQSSLSWVRLELPGFSGHLIVVADARPRTHSD